MNDIILTGASSTRTRITVSVPADVARYLRSTSNASAVVCEAIRLYRARELAHRLEVAYRTDAAESAEINREWESADAGYHASECRLGSRVPTRREMWSRLCSRAYPASPSLMRTHTSGS